MKSIKAILRNNQLSRKLLVIKDLILGKLNLIISAIQEAEQRTLGVQRSVDLLSENQVYLLKSSIDTVQAAHRSIDTVETLRQSIVKSESAIAELNHSVAELNQSLSELNQSIVRIGEDNQAHDSVYRQLLGQIYQDVHSQKYKLVTDAGHFQEIEIALMAYLYSYLPHRLAIDVGANRGDVSERLLQAGYEVYAFEPFPPVFEKLKQRLASNPNFHALPYALGAVNESRDLHVVVDQTVEKAWGDSSFYNTITPYSSAEGLVFRESIPVSVKTLAGLHESGEVPCQVGLVKIDTEGFDLEVVKGMGDFRYPVVLAEFWDPALPLGQAGSMNRLKDMVPAMRQRGYSWSITIYRVFPAHDISYYCNSDFSFEKSWGNVFFFRDHAVFSEALKWCNATMPATYFSV